MRVVRMRRGWRMNCTDMEMELLRRMVRRGLEVFDAEDFAALSYKERKVLRRTDPHRRERRWELPDGPLVMDEDRRAG